MTVYDTTDWLARAHTYRATFAGGPAYEAQEAAVVDVLSTTAATSFHTVLEFGCGFGRITKRILDAFSPGLYVATDITSAFLKDAADYVGERDADRLLFQIADLDQHYNFGPFDLVVAAEVLMHRPPGVVEHDVAKLCAAGGRVLTVDWHEDSDRYAEGCYQHDYNALFSAHGDVEETLVPQALQAVYLTTVRRAEDGQDR